MDDTTMALIEWEQMGVALNTHMNVHGCFPGECVIRMPLTVAYVQLGKLVPQELRDEKLGIPAEIRQMMEAIHGKAQAG